MATLKQYEELKFIDDFMFCRILSENEDLCKELAELVTGHKIKEIVKMNTQKSVKVTANGKGVRFDVYFEDDVEHVYDLEMQTTNPGNLKQRTRYYQSMIDSEQTKSGANYKHLKQTSIVFICTYDLFGEGLHKYTFRNTCKEMPTLLLDDGTEKIFICAGGKSEDISGKLKSFIDYISGKGPSDEFTNRLDTALVEAKSKDEWRSDYMAWIDLRSQAVEEGLEEGLVKGRVEGEDRMATLFSRLNDDGRTSDMVKAVEDKILREALFTEYGL